MEMQNPDQFVQKENKGTDFSILQVAEPYPELAKFFHTVVGHPWRWGGRDGWGEKEWQAYVSRPGFEMWIGYRAGTPVGYFELCHHEAGDVQILTMGLMPKFIGQKMGGPLLTAAVKRAWERNPTKVRLSTCSHDHPRAKDTYCSVGFEVTEVIESAEENPPIPSFWEWAGK